MLISIVFAGEMGAILQKCSRLDNVFESFLATGNLPTYTDIGLMQDSGKLVWSRSYL